MIVAKIIVIVIEDYFDDLFLFIYIYIYIYALCQECATKQEI